MCEPAWKASMLGTCFAFGQALLLFITPKLADRFGRKWIFKLTRIFDCVLFTMIIVTKDYYVTLVVCTLLGILTPGRLNVGVPYMG